jgi:hypothetical protein
MHFTFVARNIGGLFERTITCDNGKKAEVLARLWCDNQCKNPESTCGQPEFLHMGLTTQVDRHNEFRRRVQAGRSKS